MALLVRIYYNAVFGALGGLLGWMLYGVIGDKNAADNIRWMQDLLAGLLVGGLIAYFVVSVEALRDWSMPRFARLATYGILLGSIGGAFGAFLGENIKSLFDTAFNLGSQQGFVRLFVGMLARGIGWSFLGVAVGMSEGIAARSMGKFSYGTLGGAIGGFVGGCLYGLFLEANRQEGSAYLWGAAGLMIMGACIGSLSALVQGVFQPASVKVMRGWQEGREYALDKMASLVGREEHADIPLFRDMKVEKKHAYIRRVGQRYLFCNNDAPPNHTLVNDAPISQTIELHDGDRIQLGNVVLKFQMREARNRQRPARRPPTAGSITTPAMPRK